MANNSSDERPRRRSPRRSGSSDQRGGRAGQQEAGDRRGGGRGGRLSREEIEWARDLWNHKEPPDEIAQQLGVDQAQVEALIAGWTRQ